MPLYEYQCDACQHRFEVIQKFSDAPIDVCPSCGGTVKKLISSPAIQFKGTGWYITDYAKKSGANASSANKSAESASESKSGDSNSGDSKSSDSKSDSSSPSKSDSKS